MLPSDLSICQSSHAKVFDAFIQSIQANTTQRLALVKKQKAAIASLLQRVADMWVRVPGAKAETAALLIVIV